MFDEHEDLTVTCTDGAGDNLGNGQVGAGAAKCVVNGKFERLVQRPVCRVGHACAGEIVAVMCMGA